jgi:hypothetical protein
MYFDFLTLAAFAMIAVTLALQVVATRRVRRDPSFDPAQRKAQLWMIWLLPILGASIVLSVLHDEPTAPRDPQSQRQS